MSTLFLGLPVAMWMLIGLIGVIILFFIGYKRPIYEAMVIGFIFAIFVTGKYDLVWTAFKGAILNTTPHQQITTFFFFTTMNGVL